MATSNYSLAERNSNFKYSNRSLSKHKNALKIFILTFLGLYALITLFPFYVLVIRTFISTKDSADLHLWVPESEETSLDYQIGNMSVQFNLDIKQFKEDLGIPITEYLPGRMTLREFAKKYNIPEQRIQEYLKGYTTFNGWIVVVKSGAILGPLLRSLIITLASVVLLNILSIMTGIGLAGLRRRDQMFIYNLYLLQMVIPGILIILPQFFIMNSILNIIPGYSVQGSNVQNWCQIIALVIINIRGGAVPTMIYTSSISAIPRDLEEAAMLDGASRLQFNYHILLPLLKVPIAAVTVIHLPWFWNQFLESFVYLNRDNTTLLPFIYSFQGTYGTNFQVIYTAVLV